MDTEQRTMIPVGVADGAVEIRQLAIDDAARAASRAYASPGTITAPDAAWPLYSPLATRVSLTDQKTAALPERNMVGAIVKS